MIKYKKYLCLKNNFKKVYCVGIGYERRIVKMYVFDTIFNLRRM